VKIYKYSKVQYIESPLNCSGENKIQNYLIAIILVSSAEENALF